MRICPLTSVCGRPILATAWRNLMVDLITQAPPCGPDPPELAAAEPDPLAATEAELLTHLAGAHGDAVGLLAQLVDRRFLLGVTRVDPLRLDRYGVVLRLCRASGYHDVRLPFPTSLRNPAHGVLQVRALLAQAKACPRRSRH
jgi:hypothetical protein